MITNYILNNRILQLITLTLQVLQILLCIVIFHQIGLISGLFCIISFSFHRKESTANKIYKYEYKRLIFPLYMKLISILLVIIFKH